jgi:hypothetical protein
LRSSETGRNSPAARLEGRMTLPVCFKARF